MQAFAFIPARYQSSRFPGKPLALIAGQPMIQRVYDRASGCAGLSGVFVATDDERILQCVQGFGGQAVMTSGRHRSGTDRICEAAEKAGIPPEDLIVNIQGDQPIFEPAVVGRLLEPLLADPEIPMTTLKCEIREENSLQNPNHVKVVTDRQGLALYFSRSPIPHCREDGRRPRYYKHLGFYGFRMEFLRRFTSLPEGVAEAAEKLEQLRALEHGYRIRVVETEFDSIEVDVPEDVPRVEARLSP